jgi:hypothetical protein
MSAAHVCDECKRVAPIDTEYGWWHVEAMSGTAGVLLYGVEKPEYEFCSWECMHIFAGRINLSIVGVRE